MKGVLEWKGLLYRICKGSYKGSINVLGSLGLGFRVIIATTITVSITILTPKPDPCEL